MERDRRSNGEPISSTAKELLLLQNFTWTLNSSIRSDGGVCNEVIQNFDPRIMVRKIFIVFRGNGLHLIITNNECDIALFVILQSHSGICDNVPEANETLAQQGNHGVRYGSPR